MRQGEKILLWEDGAPEFDEKLGQLPPSLTAFPAGSRKSAVVVCPGGGYRMKAAHEGAPIAQMLNEAGISAFVLDYRVYPYPYPVPMLDGFRAVRVARSLGYEKVAILGFSAGGHLSCTVATQGDLGNPNDQDPVEHYPSRPDAFIPCYAVVSLLEYAHLGSLDSLLGERAEDEALLKSLSADHNITKDTPPAFIWHTAEDDGVLVDHSLKLAAALTKKQVPYALHVFPHGRHGLGLGEPGSAVSAWSGLLKKWLLDMEYDR